MAKNCDRLKIFAFECSEFSSFMKFLKFLFLKLCKRLDPTVKRAINEHLVPLKITLLPKDTNSRLLFIISKENIFINYDRIWPFCLKISIDQHFNSNGCFEKNMRSKSRVSVLNLWTTGLLPFGNMTQTESSNFSEFRFYDFVTVVLADWMLTILAT